MSAMNCANCGGSMRSTDAFCGKCGQPAVPAAPAARTDAPVRTNVAARTDAPARADVAARTDVAARLVHLELTSPAAVFPIASSPVDMSVPDTLDPLVNARYAKQLVRRFALYAGVTLIVNFIVFVVDVLLSLIRGTSLLGFVGVFATLSLFVVFVLFWVLPVPALLVNWHRLLTLRAPEGAATLDHIQQAVDRHRTPYDSLGRRQMTPPGEGRREYLELRRGFFAGYVSCFAHGEDLHISMTFWIYVSPIRALIMRLGRKVQDYTGRGNDIYQTFRYESTQATINALQACTLDGIEFATRGPGGPSPDAGLPQPEPVPAPAAWPSSEAAPAPPPSAAPLPPPAVQAPSAS